MRKTKREWSRAEAREALGPLCELLCSAALLRLDGRSDADAEGRFRGVDVDFGHGAPVPVVLMSSVDHSRPDAKISLGLFLAASADADVDLSPAARAAFASVAMAAVEAAEALGAEGFIAAKRAAKASCGQPGKRGGEPPREAIGFGQALLWLADGEWSLGKSSRLLMEPRGLCPRTRAFMEKAVMDQAAGRLAASDSARGGLRI